MTDSISLETRKGIIHKQNVFAPLTDKEAFELASLLVEKSFNPEDTIVKEGDLVDSILFIIEGKADVRRLIEREGVRKMESLAVLNPGQAIGLNENGFYSITGKRTATVVALTQMLTLYLSVPRLHGFALSNHHVSEIMRANAERMLNSE